MVTASAARRETENMGSINCNGDELDSDYGLEDGMFEAQLAEINADEPSASDVDRTAAEMARHEAGSL